MQHTSIGQSIRPPEAANHTSPVCREHSSCGPLSATAQIDGPFGSHLFGGHHAMQSRGKGKGRPGAEGQLLLGRGSPPGEERSDIRTGYRDPTYFKRENSVIATQKKQKKQ
ncbi:hypothetical protein GQ53DRAFT_336398 [Thozetella sp. PMI_491]|nr:hypothetical protein GQ53DRAFT_336398 [Thozetella sp. PMI_491]